MLPNGLAKLLAPSALFSFGFERLKDRTIQSHIYVYLLSLANPLSDSAIRKVSVIASPFTRHHRSVSLLPYFSPLPEVNVTAAPYFPHYQRSMSVPLPIFPTTKGQCQCLSLFPRLPKVSVSASPYFPHYQRSMSVPLPIFSHYQRSVSVPFPIFPHTRAPLSGTFLQTLPDLVTPLKGHSLSSERVRVLI